jgi:hypothetical protein
MRIIARKYRGRKLKSPPTLGTRPTSIGCAGAFNISRRGLKVRAFSICAREVGQWELKHCRGEARSWIARYALIETNLKSLNIGKDEIRWSGSAGFSPAQDAGRWDVRHELTIRRMQWTMKKW